MSIKSAYSEYLYKLGEKILLSRRRLRLTQEELANICNDSFLSSLSRERIGQIELGKSEPSWIEMVALSKVFGKDLNEFINL